MRANGLHIRAGHYHGVCKQGVDQNRRPRSVQTLYSQALYWRVAINRCQEGNRCYCLHLFSPEDASHSRFKCVWALLGTSCKKFAIAGQLQQCLQRHAQAWLGITFVSDRDQKYFSQRVTPSQAKMNIWLLAVQFSYFYLLARGSQSIEEQNPLCFIVLNERHRGAWSSCWLSTMRQRVTLLVLLGVSLTEYAWGCRATPRKIAQIWIVQLVIIDSTQSRVCQ